MTKPATIYLIVGLPGAGKTTHAKHLESTAPALRLTPDEWQIALFDGANPPDKRDLVEGKLIELGLRTAQLGTNVILDFGLWSQAERSALRALATTLGLRPQIVYLPIAPTEQHHRITHRYTTTPTQTFPITPTELAHWRTQFEPPTPEELQATTIPAVPPPHPTWSHWASHRWPSLPNQYEG
ncbi:AAA family ATPase [Kribbella sp. NPDC020789]